MQGLKTLEPMNAKKRGGIQCRASQFIQLKLDIYMHWIKRYVQMVLSLSEVKLEHTFLIFAYLRVTNTLQGQTDSFF